MSLSHFHPATVRWFSETLGEPTVAQCRGWEAIRGGSHTLIAAPTGSGKTLAAFLTAIDGLIEEGLRTSLPDEVRVVYVSPLKALSADIHKNLAEPRRGITRIAGELGVAAPRITAAVRTGDTPHAERAAMLRTPPHILVSTPESLYLLLTAERSREMLRTVRTVIVDEIHAVIGTRRGAHLALSLERLQAVARAPLQRIGLSATQKPIEEVARFLVGTRAVDASNAAACAIVDAGHHRPIDLDLEIPRSPLEAVMATEVWEEYYARLSELIAAHRTTLVFVNTRRMAERVARQLSDRLGEEAVTAHHGSLSKEKRLDAETRLKSGRLKALVATASLELGIDIGSVDLVCQIGSPHRIATLIQRIGRSGHTVSGTPKGRLFPVSRDDLIESIALVRAVARRDLDRIVSHEAPLDVLTQQIVAETACCEYTEDDLFALARQAWPFRGLDRKDFDAVVAMAADGFATRRGRRAALIHRDEVHARLRGRRGARLLAITSGGAIPEVADYRVVLDPHETFIGTLNEDFAIESIVGDVFQLGNASWRVLQVGSGTVRVADAKGAPPNIPFWLGEAPARSDELSRAVSELRAEADRWLPGSDARAVDGLRSETQISAAAAEQAIAYLAAGKRALGVMPTQDTLVLERFFDESGGMQLVLHAPFGSRVNKAWGLALRKRFCRQFNFELQAAATEEAVLLSLGPQHSFPLADVFRYLHPATVRDLLVQALLDAPVFQTRWRWNTTIALAVPRNQGGRKVPPQLQRMLADDLMAAVFPDAAACLENIPGDRQIPDQPLVGQTIRDCLEEAMDLDGLTAVLGRIHAGTVQLASRDTPEPSVFAHEILNARPYAFLDDAPLEERRAHAVYTRRAGEAASAGDLGALDPGAIQRVRDEVSPGPRDADELHDALLTAGFLAESEASEWGDFLRPLAATGRAALVRISTIGSTEEATALGVWVAAERLPEMTAVHPSAVIDGIAVPPMSRTSRTWTREAALIELLRGRLTILGPAMVASLAASLSTDEEETHAALIALESEGAILRGSFTGASPALEWCDRRLLARIHRYTLHRLRAEIEAVSPADFMRFLFAWQHVDPAARLTGLEGLQTIVGTLDGFELAASAWERFVLPARVERYDPSELDVLCLTGEVGWARLSKPAPAEDVGATRLVGATPVALFLREHGAAWQALRQPQDDQGAEPVEKHLSPSASRLLDTMRSRGASFFRELQAAHPVEMVDLAGALGELVSAGLVTSDGFAGLRTIVRASSGRSAALRPFESLRVVPSSVEGRRAQGRPVLRQAQDALRLSKGEQSRGAARSRGMNAAGRWSLVHAGDGVVSREAAVERQAWSLLRRYGVIFRRLLAREANAAPWRELARVYRRLEARGEIRGGRFVSGMSGEQFALPGAVDQLREVRRSTPDGRLITISGADPLNLAGIITTGERVRALATSRLVYRDGVPVAALEGDFMRPLVGDGADRSAEVASALAGRPMPPVLSGYVGHSG